MEVIACTFVTAENDLQGVRVHAYQRGYPRLAAFAGCDPNFAIYRQFKTLRHRCLLYLQDELVALEHDLGHMDAQDDLTHRKLLFSRFYDGAKKPSRRMELVTKIRDKIFEYCKLVIRCWYPSVFG